MRRVDLCTWFHGQKGRRRRRLHHWQEVQTQRQHHHHSMIREERPYDDRVRDRPVRPVVGSSVCVGSGRPVQEMRAI